MCGRFTLRTKLNRLLAEFAAAPAEGLLWEVRYNIAPSQPIPTVHSQNGQRQLSLMTWGLVPFWSKDGKGTINARAEGVSTKPTFRTPFKKQRCLIVADGFYEWRAEAAGKQPYFIHMRDDAPFAFAGLAEQSNDLQYSGDLICLDTVYEG